MSQNGTPRISYLSGYLNDGAGPFGLKNFSLTILCSASLSSTYPKHQVSLYTTGT